MPSLKSVIRRLSDRTFGTAFDRALDRGRLDPRNSFLLYWNRGLGDVALCVVPLISRIRQQAPGARIAVITRTDLRPAFELTDVDEIHVLPDLSREAKLDRPAARAALDLDWDAFGTVLDDMDPNRWLEGRRQEMPPALRWNPDWDAAARGLLPVLAGRLVVGAHVSSETARFYGYVKDWPAHAWRQLIERFGPREDVHWLLLGCACEPAYAAPNVTDLRGATSLPQLLSVIKNDCRVLIAPDSGVLTMAYYLDVPFPLDVISLWSDPRQGVLRQACVSPNPLLRHVPLVGPDEDVRKLSVEAVAAELRGTLEAVRASSRNAPRR